jgi:hypothetical protein
MQNARKTEERNSKDTKSRQVVVDMVVTVVVKVRLVGMYQVERASETSVVTWDGGWGGEVRSGSLGLNVWCPSQAIGCIRPVSNNQCYTYKDVLSGA